MTRFGIHRIDALLVIPLIAIAVAGSFGAAEGQDGRRGIDAFAVVPLVAGPLLLLPWRRRPAGDRRSPDLELELTRSG